MSRYQNMANLAKIYFPQATLVQAVVTESVGIKLFNALNSYQIEGNHHQLVLNDVGDLFIRDLTEEETEELRQTDDEEGMDDTQVWSDRVC